MGDNRAMPEASGNTEQPDTRAPDPHTATVQTAALLSAAIPSRIKALRMAVGLTAAQLDQLTGLSAGTVGRLERGDQRVYASHLYRIGQATGVDVAWFYRKGNEASDIGTSHDLEMHRLLEAYLRITDPGLKRDVFELVESLSKNTED